MTAAEGCSLRPPDGLAGRPGRPRIPRVVAQESPVSAASAWTALRSSSAFARTVAAFSAGVAAYVVWTVVMRGVEGLLTLLASAGSVFLSKLAIFAGAIEGHPHGPWELALIGWFIDVGWALALLGGLGWMERMPMVGRSLLRARAQAGRMAVDYPGIRRMASAGVALFVFVPVPGTGAIAGTLLGTLLGLPRMRCAVSVAIGSGVAVVTFAGLSTFFDARWEALAENPVTSLVGLAVLVLFAHLAWLRAKKRLQREG